MRNQRGFTLIELVVSMGIFIGLMLIASFTFDNIVKRSSHQQKSAETSTEGIVGLEMLRSDLEHAGFGLAWAIPFTTVFTEVASGYAPVVTGVDATLFSQNVPSAIMSTTTPTDKWISKGTSNTNPGVAYLVIKSTRVGITQNGTEKKWAYVNYSTSGGVNKSYIKPWSANNFGFGTSGVAISETLVTINNTFSPSGVPTRTLVVDSGNAYQFTVTGTSPGAKLYPPTAFQPTSIAPLYSVYGVAQGGSLRMPYNRADYYIRRPPSSDVNGLQVPSYCNSNTGILVKGVVQHSDGTFKNSSGTMPGEYPLLNCVGDMQVEYELDPNGDGTSRTFTNTISGLTADQVRSQLRTVFVYILAHEGKKDPSFQYPNTTVSAILVGDPARPSSSGKIWDGTGGCTGSNCMKDVFGADWRNYRWKVYSIAVHPKNLTN